MSDKFYSYTDVDGDEINISEMDLGSLIEIGARDALIPPQELPNLIAVLQSHLEEPTEASPWFIVTMESDLIGPFASENEARKIIKQGELVRQVMSPEPDIDHYDAGMWASRLTRDSGTGPRSKREANLARAYLELAAKQ